MKREEKRPHWISFYNTISVLQVFSTGRRQPDLWKVAGEPSLSNSNTKIQIQNTNTKIQMQGDPFSLVPPLKVPSTNKLIYARLGVSWPTYVNVDSPNLGFTYFNFLGGYQ